MKSHHIQALCARLYSLVNLALSQFVICSMTHLFTMLMDGCNDCQNVWLDFAEHMNGLGWVNDETWRELNENCTE